MGTQLNNPFSGGLAGFNSSLNQFNSIDANAGIQKLAQANAMERLTPMLAQTNMYNLDTMLPKTAGDAMRLGKDQQAQYQNSMQQLAYDKLNTIKALDPFMNTGKIVAGTKGTGVKGYTGGAGSYGQGQGFSLDGNTAVAGSSDDSQQALAGATNLSKLVNAKAGAAGTPATFQPSVGDIYSDTRNSAAQQLARLGYVAPKEGAVVNQTVSTPAQKLFNKDKTTTSDEGNDKLPKTKVPTVKEITTGDGKKKIIVNDPKDDKSPIEDPIIKDKEFPETIADDPVNVKRFGSDSVAGEGRRKLAEIENVYGTTESNNKAILKLEEQIKVARDNGAPEKYINNFQTMIDRVKGLQGKKSSAIEELQTQVSNDQASANTLFEAKNSYEGIADLGLAQTALFEQEAKLNVNSSDYEAKQKAKTESSKNYADAISKINAVQASGRLSKEQYAQAEAMKNDYKNKMQMNNDESSTMKSTYDKQNRISQSQLDAKKFEVVRPSQFNNKNGKKMPTVRSVVGQDVIDNLEPTGMSHLSNLIDDMDDTKYWKDKPDGGKAFKVGDGVYITGKNGKDIKAKLSSLLRSAAQGNREGIYDNYMSGLERTWLEDENATKAEKENAKRAYTFFARIVKDPIHYSRFRKDPKMNQTGWDEFNNIIGRFKDSITR